VSASPFRLVVITDAWFPQVNGVVNSLDQVTRILRRFGDEVTIIGPDRFRTIPCPSYPEIPLALASPAKIGRLIDADPEAFLHIATEGPLGLLARRHALSRGRGFTTSYHTKFPEYLSARVPVPLSWGYAFMRRFHNAGLACMVATNSLRDDLAQRGFNNLVYWSRGVDHSLFHPRPDADLGLPRPVFLCVGRVAVEKNLEAFLTLDLPGSKVVVGDGPARAELSRAFPAAHFLGALPTEELVKAYAAADVFVFPSVTDTFGNVLIEALASGLPVAAFPVTGPKDVVTDARAGVLDADLGKAALGALKLSRSAAREFSLSFSWEASANAFRDNILAAHGARDRKAA
jgi:1,2-diacylglycerol 3-alpha-glucosyltransferase/glucuronosyltransferase